MVDPMQVACYNVFASVSFGYINCLNGKYYAVFEKPRHMLNL